VVASGRDALNTQDNVRRGGLGGRATGDPAITAITARYATAQAPAAYLAVVFIRGTDGALWARQVTDPVTAGRGTWRSLGGRLASGVAAQSDVAGSYTYVFVLGTGDQFWMRTGNWPAPGRWMPVVQAAG
jgi:hypothetical protein